ncbi:MAG: citrate lyase acyl carrier protein [Cardiobacteriaceae bacterium]|nr:citrate lyase acyl carrier protein [Cardiobacteriaceae bacterium]
MQIRKESVAGTVESSDVMVYVAPSTAGVSLELNSSVGKQFDTQIWATVNEVLTQLGVSAVALRLEDRGALDCVLRARLKAALLRATDEPIDWGKVL